MIKKKPVTVVIDELDLPIKIDWVTVDANDSSPEAAAAIKTMLATPVQILKTALDSAMPAIAQSINIAEGRSSGNKKSKESKEKIKTEKDIKIIEIIQNWEAKHIESPTWKEIKRAYEEKFKPDTISRSRIYEAKKSLLKK